MSDELYPPPGGMIVDFTDAYELHQAACQIGRLANTTPAGLSPEQVAQRATLLKIPKQIIVAERDRALDRLCRAWLLHRNLPLEETATAKT